MGNQFELFPPSNIEDYYTDQSIYCADIGDRRITSAYTPWGIKCIDSQYSILIQKMDIPVKEVYAMDRVSTGWYLQFKEEYTPIPLDSEIGGPICVRVEWIDGTIKDFFYHDRPIFDIKTRKVNVEWLKSNIKKNPHLHVMIKENLLDNIESYLKLTKKI
jgi:hypothetical protein